MYVIKTILFAFLEKKNIAECVRITTHTLFILIYYMPNLHSHIFDTQPVYFWDIFFSHTRSGFPVFYSYEIILYHIPVPPHEKDKQIEQPHVSHTLAARRSVMVKWRHYVASQRIQDFLEAFFMCSQNKMVRYLVRSKKNNLLFVWGRDRKFFPSRAPFVITRQASWCQ